MTTSTPLRPKASAEKGTIHDLDNKVLLPVMSYTEAEKSIAGMPQSVQASSASVRLSPEANAILQSTPELSGRLLGSAAVQGWMEESATSGDASNLRSESYSALSLAPDRTSTSKLQIEDMMASQISLDSARLGKLHDERVFLSDEPSPCELQRGVERMNDLSLFAELSSQEPSFLEGLDTTGGLSAVGREMETIIKENEELLTAKYVVVIVFF